MRTSVTPQGEFVYGLHKPTYTASNFRQQTHLEQLGSIDGDEMPATNQRNFPESDVHVAHADWIFEIPNPLPFKGTTYIDKEWADASANNYSRICIDQPEHVSFSSLLKDTSADASLFDRLPEPMLLSLATCSTDPADLVRLAELSCAIEKDISGTPIGLTYRKDEDGSIRPLIYKHMLFEAVANNTHLPDAYKVVMVLRPGAQGGSEIVGEIPPTDGSHIYEYLRRNSYISGGHYAANMSEDAVRYSIESLTLEDMNGLRNLYFQRTVTRLAEELEIALPAKRRVLTINELEQLRLAILTSLQSSTSHSTATLWGWNFGFDYAPSKYRLHASHQQIHQQYAMIPQEVGGYSGSLQGTDFSLPAFGCGDMVAEVIRQYRDTYDRDFFTDYLRAIENNKRMDERTDLDSSLVVWRDRNAILFVPKAQTSQWELQLMALHGSSGTPVGNIIEADPEMRMSLNTGIYCAQKALAISGAKMVTSIEYPKRIGSPGEQGQHLLYAFLPRLPESPGAFSEAQLRFINGHYPEDFAAVLRQRLDM